MNTKKLLNELFSKLRKGITPGLERTKILANYLKNPQDKYPIIHVAGTNGKGTVTNLIASILKESGYKVGLYTSPHLVRFNERIQVNGTKITNYEIENIYKNIQKVANEINATFFEITTIMAYEFFAKKNVDLAVIETGMGGRYDSTNICKPLLSVITSISYDHQEFLGNKIEMIAFEKAGIIKEKVPVVIQNNANNVLNVFYEVANTKNSRVYESQSVMVDILNFNDNLSMKLMWRNNQNIILSTPFIGFHNVDNIKTVLKCMEVLSENFKRINIDSIKKGFIKVKKNFKLKGRLDYLDKDKKILLSGAHNTESIDNDIKSLKLCGIELNKLKIYFTCMKDKNIKEIVNILSNYFSSIIFVELEYDRAIKFEEFKNYCIDSNIKIEKSIKVKNIIYELINNEKKLFIGSFYLIGEIIKNYKIIK